MKRNISYFIILIVSILLAACSYLPIQNNSNFFNHKIPLQDSTFNNTYEYARIDLRFSPDNKWLASYQLVGHKNALLKVWSTHSGKLTYATKVGGKEGYDDTTWQTSIRFSPDSKTILLEGQIGPLIIWNFTKDKQTISGCSAEYVFIDSISLDKTRVYLSTTPSYDILCDMATNKRYFIGRVYADVVLTGNKLLAISPSSKITFISGRSNPIGPITVQGNNPEQAREIYKESSKYLDFWILNLTQLDNEDKRYATLIFPAKYHYILYDIKENTISQWNYKTRKRIWKKKLKDMPPMSKKHSDIFAIRRHLGKERIAILNQNILLVLDSNTGNILWKKVLSNTPTDNNLRFTSNGKYLIMKNKIATIYDTRTGSKLHTLELENKSSPEYGYIISPNGEYLSTTLLAGKKKIPTILLSDLSLIQQTSFEGDNNYQIAHSTNGKIAYIKHGNQIMLRDSGR